MSDVVEGGAERPPMPRRRAVTLIAVAALLVGVYGAVRLRGQEPSPAAGTPLGSPTSAAPGSLTGSPGPWPTRAGACGSHALLPIMSTVPLQQRTGLRVLVGGVRPSEVDIDSGRARELTGVSYPTDAHVWTLVREGEHAYALVASCESTGSRPTLLRLTGPSGPERVRLSGPVDDVIAGPAGVWGVDYPDRPNDRVVLRRPGGGALRLPTGTAPWGVTRAGIVAVTTAGDATAARPPEITSLDPATGTPMRTLGHGSPVAVGADFVLWQDPACHRPGGRCDLRRSVVPEGGHVDRYPLPAGRVPASPGTVAPDGRVVAFQLTGVHPDPRYPSDHPGGPSEVAVLDLDTGRLDVVPGLQLAPKTGVGLAFSPDGRWLLLTISQGNHGHLLAWRRGTDQLLRSPLRVPGPLAWAPPVVLAP